jgi:hypothetical protein
VAESRKAIHAYLSPDAHDAWHDFAAEQGVSVSALLEALAEDWATRPDWDDTAPSDREQLARVARQVDAARRRRRRS